MHRVTMARRTLIVGGGLLGLASLVPAKAQTAETDRAALLIGAAGDPARVETFVGTVVWESKPTSSQGAQPALATVTAAIAIPEAKIGLTAVFQPNADPSLPASHTIELRFATQPGSPLAGIEAVGAPMTRATVEPTGKRLAAVPARVSDEVYLVGLERGPDEAANAAAIRRAEWVDLPITFADKRRAKVTFEIGSAAHRMLEPLFAIPKAP